jgi:hypothetical protein
VNTPTQSTRFAPTHFKQRLADELTAHAATLDAPTGHRTLLRLRPVALTVGVAAAAAAVAVALPLTSASHGARQAGSASRTTAASAPTANAPATAGTGDLDIVNADYTVRSAPGGLVSVRLFDTKGAPGLQAALDKAGVPAKVLVPSATCHSTGRTHRRPRGSLLKVAPLSGFHRNGVRDVRPGAIVPGDHLLLVANTDKGPVTSLAITLVRDLPRCVPVR